MIHSEMPQEQDTGDPPSRRSSGSSEGQVQGREQEQEITPYSCQAGGDCEIKDSGKNTWQVYNAFQRVPAFLNSYVNYPQNGWISTRDLARKLDQVEQFTHHHSSVMNVNVNERQFLLLDAREKKEYRTSHIHGAIHFPFSPHLCMFVRPGFKNIQKNLLDPSKHSPLVKAKGQEVLEILKNLDKNVEIVVYCSVGYRSGWIARALDIQGYHAICLYGGMNKWVQESRDVYQYKTDKQAIKPKEQLMNKLWKWKEPKSSKKAASDTDSENGKEHHLNGLKNQITKRTQKSPETETAAIKKGNKKSKGETFPSKMRTAELDAQGNEIDHSKEEVHSIDPSIEHVLPSATSAH